MAGYLPKPPFPRLNKVHPLSNGLVLAMPFGERAGSTVYDYSGKNNNGTIVSDVQFINTPFGGGYIFAGDNDYISIADNSSLDFPAGFTLLAWAKPDIISVDNRIFYRYDSTSRDGYFIRQSTTSGGRWEFFVFVGGVDDSVKSDAPPSGGWQQVVAVRENDGTLKIYVDGVLQADTDSRPGAIDSNGILYIGVDRNISNDYAGLMDNIAGWNRALSQTEISQLFHDPFAMFRGAQGKWNKILHAFIWEFDLADAGFGPRTDSEYDLADRDFK